jgi:hypothetical protein
MRSVLATAAAVALTGAAAPAAFADGSMRAPVLTGPERSQVVEFMSTYGVPAETQELLFDKLDAGEQWDSLSGADPVSTRSISTSSAVENVDVYPDGSVSVTAVDTAQVGRTVSGCVTSGAGTVNRTLSNCTVRASAGLVTMAFYADYRYSYNSLSNITVKSAAISRAHSPSATVLGGTFSGLSVGVTRATAGTNLPATARASMTGTVIGQFASRTCWLQLNVPIGSHTLGYSSAGL